MQAEVIYEKPSENRKVKGPGTQAEPFCTIQAAANVVSPGQTAEIFSTSAASAQTVTVTRSGTPAAPITFTSVPGMVWPVSPRQQTGHAVITLKGVHDVHVDGLTVVAYGADDGIDVTGSSGISIDRSTVQSEPLSGDAPPAAGISIDGASSSVTVSRDSFTAQGSTAVLAKSGASSVTVTTNRINESAGEGITLDGVTNAAVTSNSVSGSCTSNSGPGNAVILAGGSSGTVENNILNARSNNACPTPAALSVDASSASGVTVGYNAFSFLTAKPDDSWAGTVYSTVADFQAAVAGEGTSDLDIPSGVGAGSPEIDSANCGAPGELSTDLLGNPRVADPLAPDASLGNGTCHADRGAIELQDSLPVTATQSPVISSGAQAGLTVGVVPFTDSLTVSGPATSPWNEAVTYTVSFGDGSAPVRATPGTAVPHAYTAVGDYTITITATDTGGSSGHASNAAYVLPATPPPATLSAAPYTGGGIITPGMAAFTASFGSSSWEVATDTLAYGDGAVSRPGTHATGATDTSWTYDYDEPGTYTATLTQTDLLGRVSTAKATITVGDEVQDVIPKGVSYTAVPAHGVVKVPLSRFAPDCCGRNQLIDVTVTGPRRAGNVVVYADGTKRTTLATVQFQAGQAAENSALAGNGTIDVYNASAGKINLDVTIYGITDTTRNGGGAIGGSYTPVTPVHVLPPTEVAGSRHVAFPGSGLAGVPASAEDVVLDITSSHSGAAGHFVTWPERSSAGLYSLPGGYWTRGQQVTREVMVPVNGRAVLENVSKGSAFFTADVVGYYTYPAKMPGSVFLPATPTRLLKVTVGGKHWVKLPVIRKNGIPATGTTAVAVNVTEAGATAAGTFTAYADGTTRPNATSLSYGAGETVATAAIVAVGKDGAIDIYNSGPRPVTLAVDLTGFYYAY